MQVPLSLHARKWSTHLAGACCLFLSFVLPIPAAADDGGITLAAIRTELEQVRAEAPQHEETRGVSPALTAVKHQLRDWVEAQLGELPSDINGEDGAEFALAVRLNAELERARLLRKADVMFPDDWSGVGLLAPLRLEYRWRQTYLVLQTAVEVKCGFDESAYLYAREDGHWKRLWESEQNTYTQEGYAVQYIRAVKVSPPFRDVSPYVLTLGTEPWCASNWHNVYVRLWSVNSSGQGTRLLLDKSELAYLGAHDIPILGSVGDDEALIEYQVGSIDPGIHSREAVLHYSIDGDKVKRIDPVALSPRDFVEEWLQQPWQQSRLWTQPSARVALAKAHENAGGNEFIQPTRYCRARDLWQVGLHLLTCRENISPAHSSLCEKKAPVYYLVRWRPPYRFTMVQVLHHPASGCTEKDSTADEKRTLFPVQDWQE